MYRRGYHGAQGRHAADLRALASRAAASARIWAMRSADKRATAGRGLFPSLLFPAPLGIARGSCRCS
jgi:hypothetical protein